MSKRIFKIASVAVMSATLGFAVNSAVAFEFEDDAIALANAICAGSDAGIGAAIDGQSGSVLAAALGLAAGAAANGACGAVTEGALDAESNKLIPAEKARYTDAKTYAKAGGKEFLAGLTTTDSNAPGGVRVVNNSSVNTGVSGVKVISP
ncbi:MAG TPA: hypothetical protein DCL54_16360 [Alphaproteobacteria bacterium]|nr:hypothetical protein [Alphaproteobacteria bacterium]HAJ48147.1 hypothetical protein [Alphaproteobacteria bacterium]